MMELCFCFISIVCLLCGIVLMETGESAVLVALMFVISALYAMPSIKWLFLRYKSMLEHLISCFKKGDSKNGNDRE